MPACGGGGAGVAREHVEPHDARLLPGGLDQARLELIRLGDEMKRGDVGTQGAAHRDSDLANLVLEQRGS